MLQLGGVKYTKKTIFLVLLVVCLAFYFSVIMRSAGSGVSIYYSSKISQLFDSMENESKVNEKPPESPNSTNFYRDSETGGLLPLFRSLTQTQNVTEDEKQFVSFEQRRNPKFETPVEPRLKRTEDQQLETTEDQQFEKPENVQFEKSEDPQVEKSKDPRFQKSKDLPFEKPKDPKFENPREGHFQKPKDTQFEKLKGPQTENSKDPNTEARKDPQREQNLAKPWISHDSPHNDITNKRLVNVNVTPELKKAKPEEVSKTKKDNAQAFNSKKVNVEAGIFKNKSLGKPTHIDYSRLDLLALEDDESVSQAWDKQTELEKKTKYNWRRRESDPFPSRPPSFQMVTKDILWVYSSFYVPPNNGTNAIVKGLGLVQVQYYHQNPYLYCHLLNAGKVAMVVKGNFSNLVDKIKENMKYIATWISCPLPAKFEPDSVTFKTFEKEKTTNIVPVVYPGKKPLRNFTVCHPALYGPFDSPQQLLHSWETYRALGAEHIYIYNMDVTYRTERVLQAYERAGLLTVLPWDREPSIKSHYRSQWISINDCVYRNRNVSRYLLVHDTDEIIVPQHNYSGWYDMVKFHESMENKKGLKTASFGVRSSFFCKEPSHDEWQKAIKKYNISTEEEAFMHRYNVTPFLKTSHENIFKYSGRAKNIIAPENIETMGIHFVRRFMPGYWVQVLTPENALTYHVRQNKCLATNSSGEVDLRILKYHKLCYERLNKLYRQIDPHYLHI